MNSLGLNATVAVARPSCVCLRAAAAAVVLAAVTVGAGLAWAKSFERKCLPALTAELSHSLLNAQDRSHAMEYMERLKNQGTVLQGAALEERALLPLYGSSELLKGVAAKASIFFRNYPTGFSVFPVGKPGCTSLILAQKLAAARAVPAGRRVAISLSPSWFYGVIDERAYRGNFSSQQALAALLNPRLSHGLKHDLAARMEDFTETVDRDPLLGFLADRLAGGTAADDALYLAACPLGALVEGVQALQDHAETSLNLWQNRRLWNQPPVHQPRPLDWPKLLALATQESTSFHVKANEHVYFHGDAAFAGALEKGSEWKDADLLMRVLRELHFKPLLLSMPLNGSFLEAQGIRRESLAQYSRRLHALAGRYELPLHTFDEHLEDPYFEVDPHDHLSSKGWMYYNQALDEFMHPGGAGR